MAGQDDVRRIALSLPQVTEEPGGFRFLVAGKAFAWAWMERPNPKRRRVASADVIAVSLAVEADKELLIELDPSAFFTEAHYDGYAAILVRLAAIEEPMLERLLTDAWRSRAPRRLAAEFGRIGGTD